jgi:hypothetical protein
MFVSPPQPFSMENESNNCGSSQMSSKDLYNKPGYITFLVVTALNILFFGYISFVHPGIVSNPGENYGIESKK